MKISIAIALLCLVSVHQSANLASTVAASKNKHTKPAKPIKPQDDAPLAKADDECLRRMNLHYYGHSFVYPPGYIETYLKVLVFIARADGEFSEDEKNALTAQLIQSLYPPEKIVKVYDMDVTGVDPATLFSSLAGTHDDNAKMLISDAAVVAAADGLSDAEKKMLRELGTSLRLTDEVFYGIVRGVEVMTQGRLIYRSYF